MIRVISTSGADDRFEVVPQVYVDENTGDALTMMLRRLVVAM